MLGAINRRRDAAMKIKKNMILLAALSMAGRWPVSAQDQVVTTFSEPVHTMQYPEIICAGCIVPEWSNGYLLHHEIEKNADPDTPMVTMYDREGKKMLTGRIWDPQSANVTVRTAGEARGGILAGASGVMQDGSIQGFLARTDVTGRTVQSVHTGQSVPERVCEAADGTVWALLTDPPERTGVIRHYSFEKGQLGSYLQLDSLARNGNEITAIMSKSYLACVKDRVVAYFGTSEYAEVDSGGKVQRRKVANAGGLGKPTRGFAVTEDGRMFVGYQTESDRDDIQCMLYEVLAKGGDSTAILRPVTGRVRACCEGGAVPQDKTSGRLWGAIGNELVISGAGSWDLLWVKLEESGNAAVLAEQ